MKGVLSHTVKSTSRICEAL